MEVKQIIHILLKRRVFIKLHDNRLYTNACGKIIFNLN
jgi:hypothetical protein